MWREEESERTSFMTSFRIIWRYLLSNKVCSVRIIWWYLLPKQVFSQQRKITFFNNNFFFYVVLNTSINLSSSMLYTDSLSDLILPECSWVIFVNESLWIANSNVRQLLLQCKCLVWTIFFNLGYIMIYFNAIVFMVSWNEERNVRLRMFSAYAYSMTI